MLYSLLLHKFNLAVKIKLKVIGICHSNKPLKKQKKTNNFSGFIRNGAIHNFSTYNWSMTKIMLYLMALITMFLEMFNVTKLTENLNFLSRHC